MIQYLRSILFALIFYPATLGFCVAGLIAGIHGTPAARAVVHRWSDFNHWLTRRLLHIRLRVHGAVPPGPYLIAAKHQAMYETIAMVRLAGTPVVVLKRELTRIPLFGWMTRRYGVIAVDRQAGPKALRDMVARGREATVNGRPIIIYPEGTRVEPGECPPLRSGFAGLYRALGLPVVPVALDSGRLWTRGVLKRSGTIVFDIGEVIPAGLPRGEIEARVHAAINRLELAAQAGPELRGGGDDPLGQG